MTSSVIKNDGEAYMEQANRQKASQGYKKTGNPRGAAGEGGRCRQVWATRRERLNRFRRSNKHWPIIAVSFGGVMAMEASLLDWYGNVIAIDLTRWSWFFQTEGPFVFTGIWPFALGLALGVTGFALSISSNLRESRVAALALLVLSVMTVGISFYSMLPYGGGGAGTYLFFMGGLLAMVGSILILTSTRDKGADTPPLPYQNLPEPFFYAGLFAGIFSILLPLMGLVLGFFAVAISNLAMKSEQSQNSKLRRYASVGLLCGLIGIFGNGTLIAMIATK